MNLCQPYYIEKRVDERHFSLNGEWSFCWSDSPRDDIEELDFSYKTELPSDVYFSLYNAGVLPHPYHELNNKQYHWVDEKIWYYKKCFTLDRGGFSGNAYLCFDGISYYSRVWLNGELIGEHEGMCGGPIVEVCDKLCLCGDNEIVVEVTPAALETKNTFYNTNRNDGSATQIIPWDTARSYSTPDYVLVGIWNSIRIEFLDKLHLSRPYMKTGKLDKKLAALDFEIEIVTPDVPELRAPHYADSYTWAYEYGLTGITKNECVTVELVISEKNSGTVVYTSQDETGLLDYEKLGPKREYWENQFFKKSVLIENPKLWYPTGLGEPFLYTVKVMLKKDGYLLDTLSFDYGIRTFEIDYNDGGKFRNRTNKFKFSVNGNDFFLKGMNWMPIDQQYNFKREEYKWTLTLAKNEGIQLIRIWNGGGPIETDDFYELCDELGIMVYQDYFIANTANTSGFPGDVLECQCSMNLYRIRNHPSLVIHCGGNEFNPYSKGNAASMFTMLDSIRALDPDRPVYYTTPDGGETHIYHDFEPVWYRHLYKQLPFVGESGIHCFPNFKSLAAVIGKEETEAVLTPLDSDGFINDFPHIVNHFTEYQPWRTERLLSRISGITDVKCADLKAYCEAAQVQAYEFYQIMVQSMLENYPISGGIMPWVFKRPYTTVAIQMVDGTGRPVLPYYAVKNAYSPVSAFLQLEWNILYPGEKVPLKVFVSDSLNSDMFGTTLTLTVYDPMLNKVLEHNKCVISNKKHYDFGSFELDESFTDKAFLIDVTLKKGGSLISENTYFPRCLKKFSDPELVKKHREKPQKCMRQESGPFVKDTFVCAPKSELTANAKYIGNDAQGYTKLELELQNIGATPIYPVTLDIEGDVRFFADDNFFLLKPNEQRVLSITTDSKQDKFNIILSAWNCDDVCCTAIKC